MSKNANKHQQRQRGSFTREAKREVRRLYGEVAAKNPRDTHNTHCVAVLALIKKDREYTKVFDKSTSTTISGIVKSTSSGSKKRGPKSVVSDVTIAVIAALVKRQEDGKGIKQSEVKPLVCETAIVFLCLVLLVLLLLSFFPRL